MCTVTYLPVTSSSFILTHNRDEHHTRAIALLPEKKTMQDIEIVFPTDQQGGGTWIAASKEFTLCLLNGGFEKHIPSPPYRHSRGLVILDFFRYQKVDDFVKAYDVHRIEPFTMIVVEHATQSIAELVHDGQQIHIRQMDKTIPHIWSSSSLYSPEDKAKRVQWFITWCEVGRTFNQEDIINFHKQKKDTLENEGILINRDEVLFTVSLTSIMKTEAQEVSLWYEDFLQQKNKKIVID